MTYVLCPTLLITPVVESHCFRLPCTFICIWQVDLSNWIQDLHQFLYSLDIKPTTLPL